MRLRVLEHRQRAADVASAGVQSADHTRLLDAHHATRPRRHQIFEVDLALDREVSAVDADIEIVQRRTHERRLRRLRLNQQIGHCEAEEPVRQRDRHEGHERRTVALLDVE